jgi:AraC family transcriptional regulator of adaptative response/methylated-DNA-[protein]-cysteine methyltransferase
MQDYYRIAAALSYIKNNMQQQPSLEEVAKAVYVSPYHFQRMFTDWAGVSPKKFLHYLSVGYAKEILKRNGASVYDAAYETGLSGTGRLHDLFVNIEGMTPGEYKNGGKNLIIKYSFGESRFGNYLVASTDVGICNLLFFKDSGDDALDEMKQLWPNATIIKEETVYHQSIKNFFNKDISDSTKIKLHLKGTPFQLKVWEALLKIPEGSLQSYSNVAKSINKPSAQRAVGSSIGSNPVGFIIPCHRVIKSVGGIGEYSWGTERKMAIIGWEAAKSGNRS